jgi:hypothetical protein
MRGFVGDIPAHGTMAANAPRRVDSSGMTVDRGGAHLELGDRWLARGAVLTIVVLQFALINNFGIVTRAFAPYLEIVLLVPLTVLTVRAERLALRARSGEEWKSANLYRELNYALGISLFVVISLANGRSLLLLIGALLSGTTHNGRILLLDAMNIWATNVIMFSLWYWAFDRGGPWIDERDHRGPSEFIFPVMTLPPGTVGASAKPGYVDYLFLSFNTSTAFSPTDTMPLSVRMKLLMMLEATISLMTLALVAARAVNILA